MIVGLRSGRNRLIPGKDAAYGCYGLSHGWDAQPLGEDTLATLVLPDGFAESFLYYVDVNELGVCLLVATILFQHGSGPLFGFLVLSSIQIVAG